MTTPDPRRSVLYLVGYLLIMAAVLGYVLWERQGRRRMVEELEPSDRSAVFESTMQSFEKLCVRRGSKGFGSYCAGQREFLRLFPECNQACRELLAKAEPEPTR